MATYGETPTEIAELAAPIFARNQWAWVGTKSESGVPDAEEIEKQILQLLSAATTEPKSLQCRSGRLFVQRGDDGSYEVGVYTVLGWVQK